MFKKNHLTLLFLLCSSSLLFAQGNAISISNFTVKDQLPSNISEWGSTPGAFLLVAQNNTWGDRPARLLITVKKGDNKICGIADGIALDYFKTRSFQTKDLLAALGNCEALPPGDYTLCARFVGQGNNRVTATIDVSTEVCKPFTVGGSREDAQKYERPTLIAPANNRVFTEKEANAPVTFRWTPIVPKPQEPVTYRLKVWQLMEGQTPVQAMTGQPVVEKDVENLTQINISSGLFPCNPNCQFVCRVQATNSEGTPYGENNGTSALSSFNINSEPVTQNKSSNITPSRINPCVPGGPSWNFGGNNFTAQPHPAGITQADVGTCDDVDFILKSNGNAKIWLKGTAGNEYIGVGVANPLAGFHANMGAFRITDPASSTRGLQISPNYTGYSVIPPGTLLSPLINTSGEGFSLITGGRNAGVKLGAYAFNGVQWSSMWETQNVATGFPNLLLTKLDGDVGIGVNNPDAKLTVGFNRAGTPKAFHVLENSNASAPVDLFTIYNDGRTYVGGDVGNGNGIGIVGGGQVPTRRGISTDGDPNGHFDFFINNWQSANGIPEFRFKNGIAPGNTIAINSASAPDLMKIDGNGRVTINNFYSNPTDDAFVINVGSTNYTNFKIKKNGYVYAREINVMPTATPFPDYVFDKDYNLMSLSNLENYIATNKHLPNIPNAKAVEKEGINVGEMQIKQMEKIEEAFLYILQLKKENEELKQRLQNLENKKSK